jgi:hypothetical protein
LAPIDVWRFLGEPAPWAFFNALIYKIAPCMGGPLFIEFHDFPGGPQRGSAGSARRRDANQPNAGTTAPSSLGLVARPNKAPVKPPAAGPKSGLGNPTKLGLRLAPGSVNISRRRDSSMLCWRDMLNAASTWTSASNYTLQQGPQRSRLPFKRDLNTAAHALRGTSDAPPTP